MTLAPKTASTTTVVKANKSNAEPVPPAKFVDLTPQSKLILVKGTAHNLKIIMMMLRWLFEIVDALSCPGSSDYRPKEVNEMEVDDDDRTWCSTKWIGGMKATLNDDVTLATRDDFTLATKEDSTVATVPTDSMSEKS